MNILLEELKEVLHIDTEAPKLHCTIFGDGDACIELVKCPKMRPRTKHIGLKYHHFRSKVKYGLVTVTYIDTREQIADITIKVLPEAQFIYLRGLLNLW